MSLALFTQVILTIHGPVGEQRLNGSVWGVSYAAVPSYDVRVGGAIHNNVPARCVEKIGEPVVPLSHVWGDARVDHERVAARPWNPPSSARAH